MTKPNPREQHTKAPDTGSTSAEERRTSAFKFAFFWFVLPTLVLVGVTMLQHHHA